MKLFKKHNLLIVGAVGLLMASCGTMHTMREPECLVRYDKSEFDYSEQVKGEATSTKILGVDWARLFKSETGKVDAQNTVFGLLPCNKTEGYALYNMMNENPGYDFIVYPQYQKTKKGFLVFSQTTVTAAARLAVINDVYVEDGGGSTGISPKVAKAMEESLAALQGNYDSLEKEMASVKEECAAKEAAMQKQVQEAQAQAAQAQQQSNTTVVSPAPVSTDDKPAQQTTPGSTTQPAQNDVTPPLSSTAHTSPSQVHPVTGTYTLIIGSYSNSENAERAVSNFNKQYPALKGQVGVVIAGEKFRVGFINFKTRNDAVAYKTNLITDYPEFKDAWPYKP